MSLGVPNVHRDILRGLTARQFREWQHYAVMEPFGEWRADVRTADIVRTLVNLKRMEGAKPGTKPTLMTIEDALLKFGEAEPKPARTQTLDQQWAMLKLLAAAHAGSGKR